MMINECDYINYMVNRFLSMKQVNITFVNDVQKYPLKPKELYKVYADIFTRKDNG